MIKIIPVLNNPLWDKTYKNIPSFLVFANNKLDSNILTNRDNYVQTKLLQGKTYADWNILPDQTYRYLAFDRCSFSCNFNDYVSIDASYGDLGFWNKVNYFIIYDSLNTKTPYTFWFVTTRNYTNESGKFDFGCELDKHLTYWHLAIPNGNSGKITRLHVDRLKKDSFGLNLEWVFLQEQNEVWGKEQIDSQFVNQYQILNSWSNRCWHNFYVNTNRFNKNYYFYAFQGFWTSNYNYSDGEKPNAVTIEEYLYKRGEQNGFPVCWRNYLDKDDFFPWEYEVNRVVGKKYLASINGITNAWTAIPLINNPNGFFLLSFGEDAYNSVQMFHVREVNMEVTNYDSSPNYTKWWLNNANIFLNALYPNPYFWFNFRGLWRWFNFVANQKQQATWTTYLKNIFYPSDAYLSSNQEKYVFDNTTTFPLYNDNTDLNGAFDTMDVQRQEEGDLFKLTWIHKGNDTNQFLNVYNSKQDSINNVNAETLSFQRITDALADERINLSDLQNDSDCRFFSIKSETPNLKQTWNASREPKLYTDTHFNVSFGYKNQDEISISPHFYFFNNSSDYNVQNIFLKAQQLFSPNIYFLNIGPKKGYYETINNTNSLGLRVLLAPQIVSSTDAYKQYMQTTGNQFNAQITMEKKYNTNSLQKLGQNVANSAQNGDVFGATPLGGIMNAGNTNDLGIVGGITNFFKNIFNDNSQYAKDLAQYNAKIADLHNTPASGRGSSNENTTKLTNMGIGYFNVNWLNAYDREKLAFYFHTLGNASNRQYAINNYEFFATRVYFNYFEINDYQNFINNRNLPTEVLEFYSQLFAKGVRLWHWVKEDDILIGDYSKENWEINLLK